MIKPLKYLYFHLIAILLVTMTLSEAHAQIDEADVYLRINGALMNSDNNNNLNECVVRVLKNEEFLEQYTTKASGKYEFFLPAGYVYRFYYEKDGFVTKNIEIDCVDAEKMDDQFIFSLNADISLFKAIDGMNYAILDQPIGKGVCNGRKGKVQFDKDYTRSMEEQIAMLYVPVEANTSDVKRVTLSEAITEEPEEDDEITVNEIFEQAEKENEPLAIEEVKSEDVAMVVEKEIEEEVDKDSVQKEIEKINFPKVEEVEKQAQKAVEEVAVVEKVNIAEPVVEEVAVEELEAAEVEEVIEDAKMVEQVVEKTMKEEPKVPASKVVVPAPKAPSTSAVNGITWRVQIGAFTSKNINAFQGLSDIDFITGSDGITRCVAGYYNTPVEAAKHKIELIQQGYVDAFITAYKGDKRISLKETGIDLNHISYTKLKEEMNE